MIKRCWWKVLLACFVVWVAWLVGPVGHSAIESVKEVGAYLEEHIEVQGPMGGSTVSDPRFIRKGGDIR